MRLSIFTWVAALSVLAAGSAQAAALQLLPATQSASAGGTISLDVQLSELAGVSVGTFDVDVLFDESLFSVVGVSFGSALDVLGLGSIQSATAGTGTLNLFELSLDSIADLDSLQPDEFVAATILFQTLGTGTAEFGANVLALGDALGDPIGVSVTGASAIVGQAQTPIPEARSSFLFAFGALVVAAALWRSGAGRGAGRSA